MYFNFHGRKTADLKRKADVFVLTEPANTALFVYGHKDMLKLKVRTGSFPKTDIMAEAAVQA